MSRRYDTVIFDLDGTLLNTLEDLADGVNAALKHFGRPERTLDEVRQFVGNGVLNLMDRAVPEGKEAKDFQAIYEWFKAYYAAHSEVKTRAYDGIPELLKQLQAEHFKMAIVSNKFHDAVCQLSRCYFGELLPVSIGENEAAGIRKKPAPDTVFTALERLGSTVEHAVYIGDSEVDFQTAQNAGVDVIMVGWGFRDEDFLKEQGAKFVIHDPAEILDAIGVPRE